MTDNGPASTLHDIRTLILSYHPIIVFETVEEERVDSIVEAVASELGLDLFQWTVTSGLRRRGHSAPYHQTNQPVILLKYIAGLTVEGLFELKDFAAYLDNTEVRRLTRELGQAFSGTKSTLIISGDSVKLPGELAPMAAYCRLTLPGPEELRQAVRSLLHSLQQQHSFRMDLGPDDLEDLLRALRGLTLKQARQTLAYCILSDGRLSREDIARIVEKKGEMIRDQGLLEYYPAQANDYELGGFAGLCGWLERARVGFSAEARQFNLDPPKGILLVGVQGCGKSLAAKHVARSWGLPLLKLDAGRLFDKYIGESEKNFRKATLQAESMAPVVLWIDEIEKTFAASSNSDADGGLGQRILGSFLTWLQEKRQQVFVVATANDISALPPELLRKGRFDEVFFVDLPNAEERRQILRIHLRLRKQDPQRFDLDELVGKTEGFSGAEIEQAVIAALYGAIHDKKPLTSEGLAYAVASTLPLSVTRREDVDRLRKWARQRFVSAN
ncbi:MAG: AAA family ATPase [Acidobacteriota bacterium]